MAAAVHVKSSAPFRRKPGSPDELQGKFHGENNPDPFHW